MAHNDTVIERTSVLTYALMEQLHGLMSKPGHPDDVSLGMIMGLAMFMDDAIGPMRSQRLFEQAPAIVLKTDAHIKNSQIAACAEILRAFGEHMATFSANAEDAQKSAGKVA